MHEMGIACSVLDFIRKEAALRAASHIQKVGLRVGEWSGVDIESLRFCFEAMVKDSELEPLELEIDFRSRQNYCTICRKAFPMEDFAIQCPECGALETEPAEGAELEIAYLELED
jgi:hydrogenase nickel incorporation protein HypA/HybF